MKKINKFLPLIVVLALFIGGSVYASFPVKNETKKEQTTSANDQTMPSALENLSVTANSSSVDSKISSAPADLDEKWILLLLWFFLGGLAAHRWYKKKPTGWNILFILTLGGCGVWAIVDLINILTGEF
ncbi:MAG: TM2 domain-containing protein [bacterium]|nr:TM2 domain-containing protein [bacterium]